MANASVVPPSPDAGRTRTMDDWRCADCATVFADAASVQAHSAETGHAYFAPHEPSAETVAIAAKAFREVCRYFRDDREAQERAYESLSDLIDAWDDRAALAAGEGRHE